MFDYDKAFDNKKPSIQIVGKWQPWHQGHTNLFKKDIITQNIGEFLVCKPVSP